MQDSEKKFRCLIFFSDFKVKMAELKYDVDHLCAACKELRASKRFSELLAVILRLVNDINCMDGGATVDGFTLESLLKLSEVSLVFVFPIAVSSRNALTCTFGQSCRQRLLITKHRSCNTW
jgi:hypothetical protein